MAKKAAEDGEPVIIKKYANRRLYNTRTSSYITLDTLAKMTREDVEFTVIDAKTGQDITHNVLTQIIVEEESSGGNLLPVNFLRQIISMYGDNMQSLMPSYLERAMENFRDNQRQFRESVETALSKNPLGKMAVENNRQFQEAIDTAWKNSPLGNLLERAKAPTKPSRSAGDDASDHKDAEIAELKAQLAAIQSRLDQLDD